MMVLPRKVNQYFSNFAKLQLIEDAEVQKYVDMKKGFRCQKTVPFTLLQKGQASY
jgi:hypothetical protein